MTLLRVTDELRLLLCYEPLRPDLRSALLWLKAREPTAYFERDPARGNKLQREKVDAGFSQVVDSEHCFAVGGDLAHPHEYTLASAASGDDEARKVLAQDGVVVKPGETARVLVALPESRCVCGAVAQSKAIHVISSTPGPKGLYDLPPTFWLHSGMAALRHNLSWGGLYPPRTKSKDLRAYYAERLRPMIVKALLAESMDEARHLWGKRDEIVDGERFGFGWDPAHWGRRA